MALPWGPTTGTRRPAQAAVALVAVLSGGYATSRIVQRDSARSINRRMPFVATTRLLRQEVAAAGKTIRVELGGGVAHSVSCQEEDAAIVCVQIATGTGQRPWPWTMNGRIQFAAVDAAGRRYAIRRARFAESFGGITTIRILRGYSRTPKGLELLMVVNGKVEKSWPIRAVAAPQVAISAEERAQMPSKEDARGVAWRTGERDEVRVSLPVPGRGERVLRIKPTRSTYAALSRPPRTVEVPRDSRAGELSLFIPNSEEAQEVEIEARAYDWVEQSEVVTLDGMHLEVRDGEPTLVVPRELHTKARLGWEVRLPDDSDFPFGMAGVPGFTVEHLSNSPTTRKLVGQGHTFNVDLLSPAPQTLGLQAIKIRIANV